MHFSSELLAIIGIAIPAVVALPANDKGPSLTARGRSCYYGGKSWGGSIAEARYLAKVACAGSLSGMYQKDEVKCYARKFYDSTAGVVLRIRRTESPQWEMPEKNCVDHLMEQINDCPRGGEGLWPGWAIRADPNSQPYCDTDEPEPEEEPQSEESDDKGFLDTTNEFLETIGGGGNP